MDENQQTVIVHCQECSPRSFLDVHFAARPCVLDKESFVARQQSLETTYPSVRLVISVKNILLQRSILQRELAHDMKTRYCNT